MEVNYCDHDHLRYPVSCKQFVCKCVERNFFGFAQGKEEMSNESDGPI